MVQVAERRWGDAKGGERGVSGAYQLKRSMRNQIRNMGKWVRGPAMATKRSDLGVPVCPTKASPPSGHSRMLCTGPPNCAQPT